MLSRSSRLVKKITVILLTRGGITTTPRTVVVMEGATSNPLRLHTHHNKPAILTLCRGRPREDGEDHSQHRGATFPGYRDTDAPAKDKFPRG